MNQFEIITDSGADLTKELEQELDIKVLPLRFIMDDVTYADYPDHREMGIKEFYDHIRAGKMPTTSAVNVADYKDALTPILQEGKDVLVLGFSSGLSTSYQSSIIAAEELREEFPDRKIYIVNTLCASMGEGLLVWYAAKLRAEGKSIDEVRDWAEENAPKMVHWVAVNDLFHLKRGGRVSATTAVVGSMLSIKPIIHVDDEGHLISVGKARGRAASLKQIADKVAELADPKQGQMVFISHSDCLEDAQKVGEMLKAKGVAKEVIYGYIGPVIGSHTGVGTVAVFALGTER